MQQRESIAVEKLLDVYRLQGRWYGSEMHRQVAAGAWQTCRDCPSGRPVEYVPAWDMTCSPRTVIMRVWLCRKRATVLRMYSNTCHHHNHNSRKESLYLLTVLQLSLCSVL